MFIKTRTSKHFLEGTTIASLSRLSFALILSSLLVGTAFHEAPSMTGRTRAKVETSGLDPVLLAAINGPGGRNGAFAIQVTDALGTQKMILGDIEFDVPGNPTFLINDPPAVNGPADGLRTPIELDLSHLFPELNGDQGPASAKIDDPPPEIVQRAGRLGIDPKALAFNITLGEYLSGETDKLEGERDGSGNLMYDDQPVPDIDAEGLVYIRDGVVHQFEKYAGQLEGMQNLPDSERLSMAQDLLRESGAVHDAYVNMVANKPAPVDRNNRPTSPEADYDNLMRRAGQAQQAGNSAEAERLRSEAASTGWGGYLSRREDFFQRLNENPLLGIYGDPSWAPFDEGYLFDGLWSEFSNTRQIPSTDAERVDWNAALLTMFDDYLQIGLDNANKAASEAAAKDEIDEFIEYGGPKYANIHGFLEARGAALGSDRPGSYVNSARGFYETVEGSDAVTDMAWTIFFTSAAALSSVLIPGSAGLIVTVAFSAAEVGIETVRVISVEWEEGQVLDMAPILGFDQLGPLEDANSDAWGNLYMAVGFGLLDVSALRQIGQAARRGDDVLDAGRAAIAGGEATTKRWGHLGDATVADAFGNPNLADDAWVHFGPASMESGVRDGGVVGFGNRSYWLRWGEIKDMNQGQLRFAIGESSASGLSDLKLMVVAPDGAGIRRVNGNYGLADEGVIDGAVKGGTFHKASDEVRIGRAADSAPGAAARGLDPDDVSLLRDNLSPEQLDGLDEAVQVARERGIPDSDIEHVLDDMHSKMADPQYLAEATRPEKYTQKFKELLTIRYAEGNGYVILLENGFLERGLVTKLDMDEVLRMNDGVLPDNIRVLDFNNRRNINLLLARAQTQTSGQLLSEGWQRFDQLAADILRHSDEDLLKWLSFDEAEGVIRVFTPDDLDNLRRIFPEYRPDGRALDAGLMKVDEFNRELGGMLGPLPTGGAPQGALGGAGFPTFPGSDATFDLGSDGMRFGGAAGLGTGAALPLLGAGDAAAGEDEGEPPIDLFITSTGGSTGPVMEISVLNMGKPATIQGSGVVLEPLELDEEDLQNWRDKVAGMAGDAAQNFLKKTLDAYCLEYALGVPVLGDLYRIAPPAVQAEFGPMKTLIQASSSVSDQLNPDSEPAAYEHSILQWAVWTNERNLDQAGFESAFVDHTRKNVEAGGQEWLPEWEQQVRDLSLNRWEDINVVLEAGGL